MTWSDIVPHAVCWQWDPTLIGLELAGNLAIAGAYFAIPWALLKTRAEIPRRGWPVVLIFAAFIFLCGVTHVLDAVLIWRSWYVVDVVTRLLTASVSLVAMLVTVKYRYQIRHAIFIATRED